MGRGGGAAVRTLLGGVGAGASAAGVSWDLDVACAPDIVGVLEGPDLQRRLVLRRRQRRQRDGSSGMYSLKQAPTMKPMLVFAGVGWIDWMEGAAEGPETRGMEGRRSVEGEEIGGELGGGGGVCTTRHSVMRGCSSLLSVRKASMPSKKAGFVVAPLARDLGGAQERGGGGGGGGGGQGMEARGESESASVSVSNRWGRRRRGGKLKQLLLLLND